MTSRIAHRSVQVEIAHDIADVPAQEWDALLEPEDVQLSHRFVSVCQRSGIEDATYRHVRLYDDRGLAGIASLSFFHVRLELLTSSGMRRTVQTVREHMTNFLRLPVLFCGLPVSFGRPCVRFRSDANQVDCAATLSNVMEDIGSELGAQILCYKEFSDAEEQQLREVEQHGFFRAASLPACTLSIRWPTFDAYLADMRASYRRQVLQSAKRREDTGLTLRVTSDFGSSCSAISALYEQVMDRVEFQLERLNIMFFRELNEAFEGRSRAILAESDGRTVAAAILLDGGQTTAFLLVGIDYGVNRQHLAYVNLVTEVVADAIRRRARRLELGQTSYDLKLRLGAITTPRVIFVKHRGALGNGVLRAARNTLFPERTYPLRRVFRHL